MKAARVGIVLALIGIILCLWLMVTVNWYNFVVFMMIAQPLLILALLIFVGAVVRELQAREKS